MPMLGGQVDAVIGVDTHRDRHAAALLDANGGVRATLEVPSDRAGHVRLLQLADEQAPGRRVWALEGTGCYGAGLTRFLVDQGEWVVERQVHHGPTRAYTSRRVAQGKSQRDIRRCLIGGLSRSRLEGRAVASR
jgi:Transposase